jgi:hypothetical protein
LTTFVDEVADGGHDGGGLLEVGKSPASAMGWSWPLPKASA